MNEDQFTQAERMGINPYDPTTIDPTCQVPDTIPDWMIAEQTD